MRKRWIILIGVILVSLFALTNQELIKILWSGDVEAAENYLDRNVGYALFFMALVMIIQNSFTVFPLILVITINIALFGFVNGFLWSWFTSIIASVIVFYNVRYIFQQIFLKRVNEELITKVDANGFAYVFQARLFPFVPTSLVNILAGLSTMKIAPFTLATIIGNFIYFFILALIPAGILSSDLDEYVILGIIFLSVLGYYLYKRFIHRRKTAINSENKKSNHI